MSDPRFIPEQSSPQEALQEASRKTHEETDSLEQTFFEADILRMNLDRVLSDVRGALERNPSWGDIEAILPARLAQDEKQALVQVTLTEIFLKEYAALQKGTQGIDGFSYSLDEANEFLEELFLIPLQSQQAKEEVLKALPRLMSLESSESYLTLQKGETVEVFLTRYMALALFEAAKAQDSEVISAMQSIREKVVEKVFVDALQQSGVGEEHFQCSVKPFFEGSFRPHALLEDFHSAIPIEDPELIAFCNDSLAAIATERSPRN